MSNKLYSEEDNQALQKSISDLFNKKESVSDKPVTDPVTNTLDKNTVSQIFKIGLSHKLFTSQERQDCVNLDDCEFKPTVATYMSGRVFKATYKKQLDGYVEAAQAGGDPRFLIALSILFSRVVSNEKGTQLVSYKFRKKLVDSIQVLNQFLKDNAYLLHSVWGMLDQSVNQLTVNNIQQEKSDDLTPDTDFSFTPE